MRAQASGESIAACGVDRRAYTTIMNSRFTAIIQKDGDWWIGWAKEIPGVNAQERTREELLESLAEALRDILAKGICKDLDVPAP